MKTRELLLLTSFVLTSAILVKIIDNQSVIIWKLQNKIKIEEAINLNNSIVYEKQKEIIDSMPEYVPQGWEVDSNGIYNPNFK